MSRRSRGPEPWDAVPTVGRTPFERSARFWLNAYPRRWREMHGDEVVGVLEDVARTDGGTLPRRLPRAEVLGLLRAGWGLRWREHPPFWPWLAYRMFSRRLPARYWWWVADDIRSPLHPVVNNLSSGVIPALFAAYVVATSDDPLRLFVSPLFWVALVGIVVGGGYLQRNVNRRQAWTRHIVEGNVPESIRRAVSDQTPTGAAG